jgi:hypothetical protein
MTAQMLRRKFNNVEGGFIEMHVLRPSSARAETGKAAFTGHR